MPSEVNPQCYHLSASSIASFKKCPTAFRLAYREGLRPDRDTESQRMGTSWHSLFEVHANATAEYYAVDYGRTIPVAEFALKAVVEHLNQTYANVPSWVDPNDWARERQILLVSFIGHQWYWSNKPIEFLASEVAFNLPLHEPRTGLPLSMKMVQRVGKIDHVVKYEGAVCALERKSTSRSIAPDSDYWEGWRKNSQISMYALAFLDLKASKQLPDTIPVNVERFGNTLIDIWHKPTTKPTDLTQKATAEFLDTGTYCGQSFETIWINRGVEGEEPNITVNGVRPKIEMGKKGFALKETVEMYGARLLQEIYETPEKFFARREIARTAAELNEFRRELFAVYQAQSMFAKTGCWFSNEQQCRATFACSYIPICYGPGASAVCDGKTIPPNFKRIFVNLTVNGHEVE